MGPATLLDPRFKKMPFADPTTVKTIEQYLMKKMKNDYANELQTESAALPSESLINEAKVPGNDAFNLWQNFDSRVRESLKSSRTPLTGPHIEIRRYMEESFITREEDPLLWWKKHGALFP